MQIRRSGADLCQILPRVSCDLLKVSRYRGMDIVYKLCLSDTLCVAARVCVELKGESRWRGSKRFG